MHLVTYKYRGAIRIGALINNRVVEIEGYPDMRALTEAAPNAYRDALSRALDVEGVPLEKVKLQPPIDNPSKLIAIGLNYMDHCREQNVDPPKQPLIFAKFPSSITGPHDDIVWDPQLTSQVDFEVELGVVMGRPARRVKPEDALTCVFGYTVLNDISARDLQFSDNQWVRAKSLDTFCPIGPAIVTPDEVPDPQSLPMRCLVNGTVWQESNTSEMIFGVAELISYLSYSFSFCPGDIIATGTPFGVGVFRDPQVFLKDGDVVVTEIEGIGRLENRCREERGE